MSETAVKQWHFDQLLYGWSQSNAFGRRGFGIIAMSEGWRSLLSAGGDPLGPLVAYPDPGSRGVQAPAHGGFTRVRGRPVIFRRLPSGTDSLNRPGNYCVQMLLPIDLDLTAAGAAALLAGDWLGTGVPSAGDAGALPALALPAPGPRRGSAAASGVACGAILQGLAEGRPVVLSTDSEAAGRAALCDAIRRLPPGLGDELAFSTLEAEPGRFGFDVCLAVAGWAKAGPDRPVIRADLAADGHGLAPDSARWGRALAAASASSPARAAGPGDRAVRRAAPRRPGEAGRQSGEPVRRGADQRPEQPRGSGVGGRPHGARRRAWRGFPARPRAGRPVGPDRAAQARRDRTAEGRGVGSAGAPLRVGAGTGGRDPADRARRAEGADRAGRPVGARCVHPDRLRTLPAAGRRARRRPVRDRVRHQDHLGRRADGRARGPVVRGTPSRAGLPRTKGHQRRSSQVWLRPG